MPRVPRFPVGLAWSQHASAAPGKLGSAGWRIRLREEAWCDFSGLSGVSARRYFFKLDTYRPIAVTSSAFIPVLSIGGGWAFTTFDTTFADIPAMAGVAVPP